LEKLLQSQEWRKVKDGPGFENTEFEFKCSDWERPRRFVAIREVITSEAEEDFLFDLSKVEYAYFYYVHKPFRRRDRSRMLSAAPGPC